MRAALAHRDGLLRGGTRDARDRDALKLIGKRSNVALVRHDHIERAGAELVDKEVPRRRLHDDILENPCIEPGAEKRFLRQRSESALMLVSDADAQAGLAKVGKL